MIALWCWATGSGQVASVFKGSYSIVWRRIIYTEKISLKTFFKKLWKWTFSHRNTIVPIFSWCFDVRRLKVSIDRTLIFHWPNCTARILFNGVKTTSRIFTALEKLWPYPVACLAFVFYFFCCLYQVYWLLLDFLPPGRWSQLELPHSGSCQIQKFQRSVFSDFNVLKNLSCYFLYLGKTSREILHPWFWWRH